MKFGGSNVWVREKSGIHLICGPECSVAIMRRWGTVMDGFIKNTLSFYIERCEAHRSLPASYLPSLGLVPTGNGDGALGGTGVGELGGRRGQEIA